MNISPKTTTLVEQTAKDLDLDVDELILMAVKQFSERYNPIPIASGVPEREMTQEELTAAFYGLEEEQNEDSHKNPS